MLPPRDYAETTTPQSASANDHREMDRVTVRSVLDRMDSAQPVTDDMINTAVTNLFSEDFSENTQKTSSLSAQSGIRVAQPKVPKAIRSLLKNVLRD